MQRSTLSIATACLAATLALRARPAAAQPEPAPSPVAWELTFKPAELQRITVQVPGQPQPRTYWYLLYRVVNSTGQDVDFLPEIVRVSEIENELTAEQAEAMPDRAPRLIVEPAIVGLDPAVFSAIRERHARTHPLLVSPVNVIGRILQGIDNARDSVAVFPELDPRVSRFTIYVGGLSGERRSLPNPSYDPNGPKPASADPADPAAQTNPKSFVLQKTLAMPYTLPGDEQTRRTASPVLGRLNWVMR